MEVDSLAPKKEACQEHPKTCTRQQQISIHRRGWPKNIIGSRKDVMTHVEQQYRDETEDRGKLTIGAPNLQSMPNRDRANTYKHPEQI